MSEHSNQGASGLDQALSSDSASSGGSSIGGDSEGDWLIRAAARAPSRTVDSGLSVGMRLLDGRFVIERKLGQGGMGAVYVARDRERAASVALKTLLREDADAVYRIKQEFRSLVDVLHPNLVRLYELFEDGGRWFFTMEFLAGKPFLDSIPEDELKDRFAQLAAGVSAIHGAGKLHRDLKPSNVLTTPEGRVVILDFGLTSDSSVGGVGQTIGESVSGTPAYMAPEQAAGRPAHQACDWYALGVMLYQALCGQLPFGGRTGEVLAAKQLLEPKPPSHHRPSIDPALDELCRRLLARDPKERAGAPEIRAVCGLPQARTGSKFRSSRESPQPGTVASGPALNAQSSPPGEPEATFVGRTAELSVLGKANEDVRPGQPVAVLLSGLSGMGKSSLMARFCASLGAQPGSALVLTGRCYERENVPFKAIDGVIDAMSRYLRQLEPAQAAALMPRDVQLVARLFPVLSRVACVEASPRRDLGIADPQELRARSFLALAELLGRIADRQRLILSLDDLQWMDLDSSRLLLGVLSAPEPPGLLLLGSYRSEEAESNPALRALLAGLVEGNVPSRRVDLGPLPDQDVRAILRAARGTDSGEDVAALAREAEGSPLFATRLAEYRPTTTQAGRLTLDQVLLAQIEGRASDAQALLRAVSLCVCPVPISLLETATGVLNARDLMTELRQENLIRPVEGGGDARVVPYHDRIRECVSATLDLETRRALHGSLARAWSERPDAEPDTLVTHWLEAGDLAQAGPQALRAARQARGGMAFDRAALRFRQALELLELEGPERRALLVELGDALAAAGDGPKAAEAYLKAADEGVADDTTSLRWKATVQLLYSHNAPDATQLLLDTLPALGVPVPATWRRTLSSGAELLRLRFQTPGPIELKPEAERDPELLRRFDTLMATTEGFWGTPRAELFIYFANEVVRLGRLTGEPGRSAHAACIAELHRRFVFGLHDPQVGRRVERYRQLIHECVEPAVRGHALIWLGHVAGLVHTDLAGAVKDYEDARRALTGLPGAHAHLALTASMMQYFIGWHVGDFDLVRRIGRDVEAGDARGNRMVLKKGRFARIRLALAADDERAARLHLERSNDVVPWEQPGLFEAEQVELAILIELYAGRPEAAIELVERKEPEHRSNMWWPHVFPCYAHAALDCAARDPKRARTLHHKVARQMVHVRSKGAVHQAGLAVGIDAAIALQRGDRMRALALLRETEESFAACGSLALLDMARRQRGLVQGGGEGEALIAAADAALAARGVVNPERFTHAHLGGFRYVPS